MRAHVDVKIPDRDVPRPLGLVIVGAASLAVGLAIAWWGMEEPGAEAELPEAGAGPSTSTDTSTDTGVSTDTGTDASTGAAAGTSSDADGGSGDAWGAIALADTDSIELQGAQSTPMAVASPDGAAEELDVGHGSGNDSTPAAGPGPDDEDTAT